MSCSTTLAGTLQQTSQAVGHADPAQRTDRNRCVMILSVKHEFIYFANARTATTSLESVLRELDETAVLLPELSEFWNADPFLRTQNLKHIRPCLLKPFLDENAWNGYFKFTFVRNPWDWCLSQYFRQYMRANTRFDPRILARPKELLKFLRRRGDARRFEKFGDEEFERIWKRMKRFRGIESDENYFQSRFVVDDEGREMLDFVGRFESLEADTRSVLDRLELGPAKIPRLNTSRGKTDFTKYYTESSKQLVAERYARDIGVLGYRAW